METVEADGVAEYYQTPEKEEVIADLAPENLMRLGRTRTLCGDCDDSCHESGQQDKVKRSWLGKLRFSRWVAAPVFIGTVNMAMRWNCTWLTYMEPGLQVPERQCINDLCCEIEFKGGDGCIRRHSKALVSVHSCTTGSDRAYAQLEASLLGSHLRAPTTGAMDALQRVMRYL